MTNGEFIQKMYDAYEKNNEDPIVSEMVQHISEMVIEDDDYAFEMFTRLTTVMTPDEEDIIKNIGPYVQVLGRSKIGNPKLSASFPIRKGSGLTSYSANRSAADMKVSVEMFLENEMSVLFLYKSEEV